MKKLNRSFFNRPTLTVAKELLGKVLVFKNYQGLITETEAYIGFHDPASHAYRGKTPRTEVMFGESGFSYVYFIYGMYYCLNFVTEKKGFPAGVLIRGIKLIENFSLKSNVKGREFGLNLDGPGKLCRHLGITKEHNQIDIVTNSEFYVGCINRTLKFSKTPRIGIKVGTDKLWRFVADPFEFN